MVRAKKILITTESHEILTLHVNSHRGAAGFCGMCDAEVEMLSLEQAVSITRIHTRDMVRLVDASEIHSIETNTGHYLICSDSARRYMADQIERKEK
jgi:hypothetical protein